MKRQTIFKDLARYYDLFYSWKNYQREAETIAQLIDRHKTSSGRDLLEVACGTGRHLQYLKNDFSIVATDLNEGMLRIARKNVDGVTFKRADMVTLDLGREFDAIICLFSSIGYVKTYASLRKTLHNFGRHLKKGGVLIVEPWFAKSDFKVGNLSLTTYNGDSVKIARLCVSKVRGDVSVMDMHYLIGEKGKQVEHHVDRHELAMFDRDRMLDYMRQAGMAASFQPDGLMQERGLFIGIKT
jgi:ubiquinone/menaquinone biosynthesis C-methylase UbiE